MNIKETVLDRITKALGNYLSVYANKNVLNELCDKVEELQQIKDNLEKTKLLLEKEDPQMAATLGSFILQKEEQIDRLMKSKIPELFPKPEIISADDYERHSGGCGCSDYFKLKKPIQPAYPVSQQKVTKLSDVLGGIMNSSDPLADLEDEKQKKKERPKRTISYASYSSGGCRYSSGGCGSSPRSYGGC